MEREYFVVVYAIIWIASAVVAINVNHGAVMVVPLIISLAIIIAQAITGRIYK